MTVDHDSWTLDGLIEGWRQHLERTRGLREPTLRGYEWNVRQFVRAALGDDPVDPARLECAAVLAFIVSMSDRFCPSSMRTVGTALRSFFAYLRVEGLCEKPLAAAIPTVACWRLSTLPKALSEEQLQRVLAPLAASSPYALRDRAIVLCLATLGLRPREVADLGIDDIDWGAGVVHLDGRKTRRGGLLPLPREAGRAIVAYLRQGRPTTDERRVFVQHRGPRCGQRLSANAVSEVVARALRRAGVAAPLRGGYVFRHTVASRMVQQGASLKVVADLLGHASLDSVMTYAKLDLPALRAVALPWPGAAR